MNYLTSLFHKNSENDNLFQEPIHDTYKADAKLSEPSVCFCCGAVYRDGSWQWLTVPKNAHQATCSACHRIKDRFPAGILSLTGDYLKLYRFQIMHLLHDFEEEEAAKDPLKRIMNIEEINNATQVSTTDTHLARGMGVALHHAYQGVLAFNYSPEQSQLMVNWSR
jgi:hypothetical protein